jgi:Protein of unknown function (DUF1428)
MSTALNSEIGSHVRLYLYKLPTKNHDAMVNLSYQFAEVFKNHGCYARSFQVESLEKSENFSNVANAVSCTQDEEVWLDLEFTEDLKHRHEVDSKIQNDESAGVLMKRFLELTVRGSKPIKSDFIIPGR